MRGIKLQRYGVYVTKYYVQQVNIHHSKLLLGTQLFQNIESDHLIESNLRTQDHHNSNTVQICLDYGQLG